jgi:hypothetical protein
MPDPHAITIEERRHNEILEKLHRLAVGLELLNETAERQLKAFASAESKLESGLRFFIEAWQQRRAPRKPKTHQR